MGRANTGPLIWRPQCWTLVFDRKASGRFMSAIALGRYKHVRAFAYVPYLHAWVFYDPHIYGTDIILAAPGSPMRAQLEHWAGPSKSDLMLMPVGARRLQPPVLGWCVPAIKRLIGLRSSALRPDALWRDCLRNGGKPLQASHGFERISSD